MIEIVLSRPTARANVATQIDFLELAALIDPSGRVRIDTLIGDRALQAEEAEVNIGNADRADDEFIGSIENEYDYRTGMLGESYPFRMSEDAEELTYQNPDNDPLAGSYLVCLIASHIGGKADLRLEIPHEQGLYAEIITQMRNRVFQMIGTIALAGCAGGPAVSVGWPRVESETIIKTMNRAFGRGFPIQIRAEPNYTVLRGVRDDGVDVIAWEHVDPPPSPSVWFGQIASGRDWRDKTVTERATRFAEGFLCAVPTNKNHATIIPFHLDDNAPDTRALRHRHGHILDRIRLTRDFKSGLNLIEEEIEIDESENTQIALDWVNEFVQGLQNLFGET